MRQLLIGAALIASGCSGNSPVSLPLPSYDSSALAQAALKYLDKNKDSQIDGNELDACPALKTALPAVDKNNDKRLSASELKERMDQYAARNQVPITVIVTLDEQPLAGAAVTLEPEPFMEGPLKPATAITDQDGTSSAFQVAGQSQSSLPAGLYRIRVVKEGARIAARYNRLSREVLGDPRQGEVTIELALTSR